MFQSVRSAGHSVSRGVIQRVAPIFGALLCVASSMVSPGRASACTNFLLTKGATSDGSTIITYAADSHELYGALDFYPAASYKPGAMREVVEWDTGRKLGKIPEVPRTYKVVGNMNEHQVVIGETTFGGRVELHDKDGHIDYGSLMYIALQRAKSAREAIRVMTTLAETHGYCSEGESFSVADPKEVWILEMIGKGKGAMGAVWVARRVPDGYISAHANQSRIREFPQNDPENCVYSKDVISFARDKGYFKGRDEDFRFADAYAPMTYLALRCCEARVWSMFRRAAPSLKLSTAYVKGVRGAKPLPLWIRPDKKLSVTNVIGYMRDHFEDSEFDLGKGIGAGPYALPYRWRPLTWKLGKTEYLNERSTATQQTGFSFVSQSRDWLPNEVGGVLWFAVDDTASTVYVPMYAGLTRAPKAYAKETATFTRFSWDSAFWVFNWVANSAYSRYKDMIQDIQKVQGELEARLHSEQDSVDQKASKLFGQRKADEARAYLTSYAEQSSALVVARYRKLGEELLMKYLDGNVRDAKGKVTHPGYPKEWYERIVKEQGKHYRMVPLPGETELKKREDAFVKQQKAQEEAEKKLREQQEKEKREQKGAGEKPKTTTSTEEPTPLLIPRKASGKPHHPDARPFWAV